MIPVKQLRDLAISPLPVRTKWYAIPLRPIAGVSFVQDGFAKLRLRLQDFVGILHVIGAPTPDLSPAADLRFALSFIPAHAVACSIPQADQASEEG